MKKRARLSSFLTGRHQQPPVAWVPCTLGIMRYIIRLLLRLLSFLYDLYTGALIRTIRGREYLAIPLCQGVRLRATGTSTNRHYVYPRVVKRWDTFAAEVKSVLDDCAFGATKYSPPNLITLRLASENCVMIALGGTCFQRVNPILEVSLPKSLRDF